MITNGKDRPKDWPLGYSELEIKDYYVFPPATAFILTRKEYKEADNLLAQRRSIYTNLRKISSDYDLDTEESVKEYEKAYNEYKQSDEYKKVFPIIDRLYELDALAITRYADSFKDITDAYNKAKRIIKKTSLVFDTTQQTYSALANPAKWQDLPDLKRKPISPYIEVVPRSNDKATEDDPEPEYKDTLYAISQDYRITNIRRACGRRGWAVDPIGKMLEERARYLLTPEGKEETENRKQAIINKVKEAYLKSKKKALAIEEKQEIETITLRDHYEMIPSSSAINLMMEALSSGDEIEKLPSRKRSINHEANYKLVKQNTVGRKLLYNSKNGKESVAVEISDISRLAGNNNPIKKMLVRILSNANKQALYKGIVTNDVHFHVDDLVNDGQYSSRRTAKKGAENSLDILYGLKVKLKGDGDARGRTLFPSYDIEKNGKIRVTLNPELNWGSIASFFMVLPTYYYKLSNRAGDLIFYVCYLARQNINEIKDHGYFTISLRALQSRLMLPNEKKTKNPQRDIKGPIAEALEEIEKAHLEALNNDDLQYELRCEKVLIDDSLPITEYLDKGYLKVYVNNKLADYFIATGAKNEQKKLEADLKKERIEAIKQAKLEEKKNS